MSTQNPSRRTPIRLFTLRRLTAPLVFLVIAILAEYLVVLYAESLGVNDVGTIIGPSFKFPGTDWSSAITISPIFHLVPIAVVIALVSSWIYLSKQIGMKSYEVQIRKTGISNRRAKEQRATLLGRIKSAFSRAKSVGHLGRRIRLMPATLRSALIGLIVFLAFVFAISLLAYPELIHQTITTAYRNNPSILDFVKGTGEKIAPASSIFSTMNNALLTAAPGFRGFALGLGSIIEPLASLDNVGKYLALQNGAAWISAMAALLYGEYRHKGYRNQKK